MLLLEPIGLITIDNSNQDQVVMVSHKSTSLTQLVLEFNLMAQLKTHQRTFQFTVLHASPQTDVLAKEIARALISSSSNDIFEDLLKKL